MNLLVQIQNFFEPFLHSANFILNSIIFCRLWAYRSDAGISRKGITLLSGVLQWFSFAICVAYVTGMYVWTVSFLEVGLNATLAAAIVCADGNLSDLVIKKKKRINYYR